MTTTPKRRLCLTPKRRIELLRNKAAEDGGTWRDIRNTYRDKTSRIISATHGAPWNSAGTVLTWIEEPEGVGLRFVGYADALATSIRHQGWYTEDDGDNGEVMRGVVYQLPARDGMPRYVSGYADPCNENAAALAMQSRDWSDDQSDAARFADSIAEVQAEREREYQRAWRAGADYVDAGERIAESRREILELLAEARPLRRSGIDAPALCAALRAKVSDMLRDIERARNKRAELFSDHGSEPGFQEHLPA